MYKLAYMSNGNSYNFKYYAHLLSFQSSKVFSIYKDVCYFSD